MYLYYKIGTRVGQFYDNKLYDKMTAPPPPPPSTSRLFVFQNKAILRSMSVQDLIKIPIWEGNRILDEEHKAEIAKQVGEKIQGLDIQPFHVVCYVEDQEDGGKELVYKIIDGQHRVKVIKEYCATVESPVNFPVLVVEKRCADANDVIQYFKVLNHVKAIQWKEDENMVIMSYILAMMDYFATIGGVGYRKYFKNSKTQKPYLDITAFRDALRKRPWGIMRLQEMSVSEFAEFMWLENRRILDSLEMKVNKNKVEEKAVTIQFGLAFLSTR